jgi:hypothetical protein
MAMQLKMPPEKTAASATSEQGQRRYRTNIVASLVLLVVASIGGLISDSVGGWISAAAFAASLLLTVIATTRWQHDWHGGRALAEEAKSLTWRYAVGGAPFGLEAEGADRAYAQALDAPAPTPADFGGGSPPPEPDRDDEIAIPAALRGSDLGERRDAYRSGRLDDQIRFYTVRARALRRSASWWGATVIGLEIAGIAGAVAKGLDLTEHDWLALFATAAAAVVAWRAVDDDAFTSRRYIEAAHALAALRDDSAMTEKQWADYVARVEAALTSEHDVWWTRRR